MKAKGINFFHLIICLLLAVGCGSEKTKRSLASEGGITSTMFSQLGLAYDSSKNKFLGNYSCIEIPKDTLNKETGEKISAIKIKPPMVGELTARLNVNASQLAKETLLRLGARLNSDNTEDLAKVSAVVGDFAKLSSNRFTSNIVYSLKLSGGKKYIDPQAVLGFSRPDLLGDDPDKINLRRRKCGDSFLSSKELGANLQAILTFEFDTEESKKSFDAQASLEISGAGGVRKNIEFAKQNSKISLNITQSGGKPSHLGGLTSGGGFRDITKCESYPEACIGSMDSFFQYAPKFKDQFKNEKGEDLELYMEGNYTFDSYNRIEPRFGDLGLQDESRKQLESYRNLIASKFLDEYGLFLRSQSLLNRSPRLEGDSRITEIYNAQIILSKRMQAITHATRTCYGLDGYPVSKEDYELKVTKCGSMAKKLLAFLYDKGPMNTVVNCKLGDKGIPENENPESDVTGNWYYPLIPYGDLTKKSCFKIAKADIKFDPTVLAIHPFNVQEWLQLYDRWRGLLVKSKFAGDANSKLRFKVLAKQLLSEGELFTLYHILKEFFSKDGKPISLTYGDFNVFDTIDSDEKITEDNLASQKRDWDISKPNISMIENSSCQSLASTTRGVGEVKSITNLRPITVLKTLEYLNLTGNQVSDLTPLRHLPNLETLYLDKNPIKGLSALGIKREQIKVLSLKNLPNLRGDGSLGPKTKKSNRLESLQEELKAFKKLQRLDLSQNKPWPIQEIFNVKGGFPSLQKIYLTSLSGADSTEKKIWKENLEKLLNYFNENREDYLELNEIHISIDSIGESDVKDWLKGFSSLPSFTKPKDAVLDPFESSSTHIQLSYDEAVEDSECPGFSQSNE